MKNRVKLTSPFFHFITGLICVAGMSASIYYLYNSIGLNVQPYVESKRQSVFNISEPLAQNLTFSNDANNLIQTSISTKEKEAELLKLKQEKEQAEKLAKQQAQAKRKAAAKKTTAKKTTAKTTAAKTTAAAKNTQKQTIIPDLMPAPLEEPFLLTPTQSQYISEADLSLTEPPSLEFAWDPVPRAQKYYFELFDKENRLLVAKYTTRTQLNLDDELYLLSDEGEFSWRVTASAIINNKNLTQVSERQTFIIGLEPIAPVVIDKTNLFVE